MRISACVIVKNEEENIARWLACVQQIADEYIVIDTGSTDRTVELAEQGGARVYPFVWCDDFSAAKNFALEQASGEWIIFWDADEYFPNKVIPKLKHRLQEYHPNRKIVGIISRLLNIDKDDNNRFMGAIGQVRVFRNMKSLRYAGQIHEHLLNTAQGGRRLQVAMEVEIYHTGYSQSLIQKKLRRNLRILQQRISQAGEQVEDYLYLMDCYFGLGDYEKAIEYAHKTIDSKISFVGMDGHAQDTLIVAMIKQQRPQEEILRVIDMAAEQYPAAPEYPLRKGILYWDSREYLQAQACLQRGLQMQKSVDAKATVCMEDNARRLLPYAYMYLGKLAEMQFQPQAAAEYFLQGLEIYPYEQKIFACFYQSIRGNTPADIIELLNQVYDKKEDAAFLADVLYQNQAGKVYLYYAKLAGCGEKGTHAYLAAGRYDAALICLRDELDSLYRLGILSAREKGIAQDTAALSLLLPCKYKEAWGELCQDKENVSMVAEILQRMQKEIMMFGEKQEQPI